MRRLLVFALLTACGSDDPAPIARVLSSSPDALTPTDDLADDVRILVEYEDADGDLGEGMAQVHDCRSEALLTVLPIPAIAPSDVVGEPIRGSLSLYVNDVGTARASALPAVCDELDVSLGANETVFCVVLVDAKEHTGPGDCTKPIALAP
jgi:hypothetical protein